MAIMATQLHGSASSSEKVKLKRGMASTAAPSRVLSAFNIVEATATKIGKAGVASDTGVVSFNLNHDIYNFYFLLNGRYGDSDSNEKQTLFSILPQNQKVKITMFALFSFCVQMSGILYLLSNWSDYSWAERSEQYLHDCRSIEGSNWFDNEFDVNGTAIDDQICEVLDFHFLPFQPKEAQIIIAKFIAILMVTTYVISDILSVPRLITLWIKTVSKKRTNVCFSTLAAILCTSQMLILATLLLRMFQIIYNQDSVIDILTAGISFIILTEIDNKCYEHVADLNIYGEKLFQLNASSDDMKNTIFNYVDCLYWDCILLGVTVVFSLCLTSAFLFDTEESISYTLVLFIGVVYSLIVGVVPCIPFCCGICKQRNV